MQGNADDDLFFGSLSLFRFSCNYRAKTSTNRLDFKVSVVHTEREVEEFVHWDNTMALSFYNDEKFTDSVNPEALMVGKQVHFQVDWIENFVPNFPVVFYASYCTVESKDGLKSYDIIVSGCGSDLVGMQHISNKYTSQKLQLSYQSFAFTSAKGSFDMSLFCTLEFCLKDSENGQLCEGDDQTCPYGYSP